MKRAAVIGGGTMGLGIAQVLARAEIDCAIADRTLADAIRSRDGAGMLARSFEEAGLWSDEDVARVERHIRAAELADAVADAELVVEAVPEDPALKREILGLVEAAAPSEALVVTNTSAIPIASLSEAMTDRSRFLGWHWFNPAQWVPCVEVIPAPETAERAIAQSIEILRSLGKRPARVGDRAGFVANRIQFAMFKEAAAVVADGVADAETVDEVVRASFGFRLPFYGPFTIADMAGLDVYAGAYEALREEFGESFAPPASLVELVDGERLGTKSGSGYRNWTPDEVEHLRDRRDRQYAALDRLLDGFEKRPI